MQSIIYSILLTALVTSGLTYYTLQPASEISSLKVDVERWRSRAFEAEQKNDALYQRMDPQLPSAVCDTNDGIEQDVNDESIDNINDATPDITYLDRQVVDSSSDQSDSNEEWDMLVSGALELGVQRLGINLDPEKQDRLMSALSKIRDASLLLDDTKNNVDDPDYLRDKLQQSLTLLAVDRLFRKELGVGVSQFVDTVSPSEVEEINFQELKLNE